MARAPLLRPIGMYADDSILQATTDAHLERQLVVLQDWANESGMKISWQKCAALGTTRPLRLPDGGTLPMKSSATYLGVSFRVYDSCRGVD